MFLVRPQNRSKIELDASKNRNRLVCKICKTLISQQSYLIAVDGKTPYYTFYNPSHYRFDIMTLSNCYSVLDVSPFSFDYTWFAGYAWSVLCCSSCYEHLGWRFRNQEKNPPLFFALIQNKLEDRPP
ncbi:MAG: hypothetical protein HQM13_16240 [SAR324 cluster bacterium]|nr:hypothetical protein [SAR324 cluster bacterium]